MSTEYREKWQQFTVGDFPYDTQLYGKVTDISDVWRIIVLSSVITQPNSKDI